MLGACWQDSSIEAHRCSLESAVWVRVRGGKREVIAFRRRACCTCQLRRNTANTYNPNQQVYVCDNEDDGAYDWFESAGATFHYLYDGNGATGAVENSGAYGKIYRHRVCESVQFGPVRCGRELGRRPLLHLPRTRCAALRT